MSEWARAIDWEKVRLEFSRGVQLNILAAELAGDKISYSQFCRQFHKIYPSVPPVTMRLEHKPGEKTFFDYCEGIDFIDRATGEVKSTSLCCAVMAMSSFTYGEFTFTQKRDELLRSMENSFRYFGPAGMEFPLQWRWFRTTDFRFPCGAGLTSPDVSVMRTNRETTTRKGVR